MRITTDMGMYLPRESVAPRVNFSGTSCMKINTSLRLIVKNMNESEM